MSFFDGYIGVKKDFPTVKSGFHPFRKKRKKRKKSELSDEEKSTKESIPN